MAWFFEFLWQGRMFLRQGMGAAVVKAEASEGARISQLVYNMLR